MKVSHYPYGSALTLQFLIRYQSTKERFLGMLVSQKHKPAFVFGVCVRGREGEIERALSYLQ